MKRWELSLLAAALTVAAPVAAQEVFFGSLHSHTSYSDGSGTPEDAYKAASSAGLDFFAITEHNHAKAEGTGARRDSLHIATDPGLYRGRPEALVETADRLDEPDVFVALYGQEFSTISSGNHVNVFGVPDVIRVADGDYGGLHRWAGVTQDNMGRPPVIQMNHPEPQTEIPNAYGQFAPSDRDPHDFPNDAAWLAAMDPLVELIEVLSGPALDRSASHKRVSPDEGQYLRYLDIGFHLAPTAGHDNHWRTWGTSTDTRTAVIAARLTRTDIMAALRARRVYATQDPNLHILYRANDALQGDIAPAPAAGTALSLTVSIRDEDEPHARYQVDVLSDLPGDGVAARRVARLNLTGDTPGPVALPAVTFAGRGQYVLLRVIQTNAGGDTDRAWTAPVWFE